MIAEYNYKTLPAVKRYKELNTSSNELDNFISLALEVCEASIAVISLVDGDEEMFLAAKGTDKKLAALSNSFSLRHLLHYPVLTITDVANHKRFSNADLLTVAPHMRFYAGAVLASPGGDLVGRIYVLDQKPRQLTKSQESCLHYVAIQVIQYLEQQVTIQCLEQQLQHASLV